MFSQEDLLRASLQRGLVVKISGPEPFPSTHPHRFIVLNYNPDTETVVVAAHATHQVQKECEKAYEQGEKVETVVVIRPGIYDFFPKQTAFNCNDLSELTFAGMLNAMKKGLLKICADDKLTPEDLSKLVDGVLVSKQTSPYTASLVTPKN